MYMNSMTTLLPMLKTFIVLSDVEHNLICESDISRIFIITLLPNSTHNENQFNESWKFKFNIDRDEFDILCHTTFCLTLHNI